MPPRRRAEPELDYGESPPAPLPPPPPRLEPEAEPDEEPKTYEPPAALVELGEPPTDAVGVIAYMQRALAISAREAMVDKTLSPVERRRELRQIAGSIRQLAPESDLWEAKQLILGDRAELEERRRRPKLEPLPPKKVDAGPR